MTAPDVLTAAQAEAERRVKPSPTPLPGGGSTDVTQRDRDTFIEGAVWGAALVTPTREQLLEAITVEFHEGDPQSAADAVIALIQEHVGKFG